MFRPARTLMGAAMVCACASGPDTGPGVSLELARARARTVSNVRYALHFDVPERMDEKITGNVTIAFALSDVSQPLVLDYKPGDGAVHSVRCNGTTVALRWENGHIIVRGEALSVGENTLDIEFAAGDGALNRNPEYLYTLFVPDRASSAFPSFDQPDIKGTYRLSLTIPSAWKAVANGRITSDTVIDGQRRLSFAETRPLPTYVVAFVAGVFRVETAHLAGGSIRLFHRETDSARIADNLAAIFDLHQTALLWLEEYTGIPYPFQKFDLVAIPAFQFGAMEHPGATIYRADGLFLDEDPTPSALLARASRIAHETAHMWFGNLVTMRWFDDVWMKEVFANFLAAKIVNPSFPHIDHDLRFFLRHHPLAYGVDRTEGANSIRQELPNLLEAGTLYGAIIYQKAPIIMRQLEALIGESEMREGLREYLLTHQLGNAAWPDLIAILDRRTDLDLATWSDAWVDTPGRPTVEVITTTDRGSVNTIELRQTDPLGRGMVWLQDVQLTLGYGDRVERVTVRTDAAATPVDALRDARSPRWLLAGSAGLGYGYFKLDPRSREFLARDLATLPDATTRAVAWLGLVESMLEDMLAPTAVLDAALATIPTEPDDLLAQRMLQDLSVAFWRFLDADAREVHAGRIETMLWRELERADRSSGRRAAVFDTYVSVATTRAAVGRLEALWQGNVTIAGLAMTERRLSRLAQELGVRDTPDSQRILERQLASLGNPDRRAWFAFVMPALAADSAVRDSVFESFANRANREHEPWVLDAMRFLNHPLRARQSEHYLMPGLSLVEEIQATGDIFFPLRWLDALCGGHRSRTAAATVRRFLDERPRYPERLKGKILQAADPLFRASGLR